MQIVISQTTLYNEKGIKKSTKKRQHCNGCAIFWQRGRSGRGVPAKPLQGRGHCCTTIILITFQGLAPHFVVLWLFCRMAHFFFLVFFLFFGESVYMHNLLKCC